MADIGRRIKTKKRYGVGILVASFIVLAVSLAGLFAKVSLDLNNPFQYHMSINGDSGQKAAEGDGSEDSLSDYNYTVTISKHWLNDPGGPLENYGAQYDNAIINNSSYDLVNWHVVVSVPVRNITIDSYWNGEWEYDKSKDKITIYPDEMTETIKAGETGGFGAVIISDELMDFEEVTLVGCRYKPVTKYVIFWFIMVLLVVWATSLIAYILYRFRDRNYRKNAERLNDVISQTMTTFANFIDTKDEYTKGHSARVAYYAQKIAEKMGMSDDEIRDIGHIGLMHDCGKLAIPENILNKPGKLSEEEFDIMRRHTTNGGNILKDFTAIEGIRDGALYHHERYDGKGYMQGLAGEDIPLVARIIGVADALDAMNSDRCYRKHLPKEEILSELETYMGKQFDPKIARITIDMIKSGEIFIE
ncbi:MAG: HD-GYP domain-containing protein [Lachnospiraceae bacterium]|nr:HD-GYP domain-containing protein [Lachnospiraceae bacterium]